MFLKRMLIGFLKDEWPYSGILAFLKTEMQLLWYSEYFDAKCVYVRCIWNVLGQESGANGLDTSLGMDSWYENHNS